MILEENEKYEGPDGKSYPKFTPWVNETCAAVAKGDLSTFLRDWMGCLMPIGYQKEIGFEYQYTSDRGFEGWALREIGSLFSVNKMLAAECYKNRMETGLTFFEMGYTSSAIP